MDAVSPPVNPAVHVTGNVVPLRARIAMLEAALRKWRDDYQPITRNDGEPYVYVPVHQIEQLLVIKVT